MELITSPFHRPSLAHCVLFALDLLGSSDTAVEKCDAGELQRVIGDTGSGRGDLDLLRAFSSDLWEHEKVEAVLEALSQSTYSLYFSSGLDDAIGRRLENIAADRPGSRGTLRLLAVACRYGYRPIRANSELCPDTFSDPAHRASALLVRLATGQWGESDGENWGRWLAQRHSCDQEIVSDALAILSHLPPSGPRDECLLTALYGALAPTAWEARQVVMTEMLAQQRRRLSTLFD